MNDPLLIDADPAYIEYLFATERYIWLSLSYDLAAVLDMEGCFEEVNTGWERATGYSMEELTGKYLLEFMHFADRERSLAHMQSLVTSDIGSRQFNFRFRCRGGLLKDLNWNVIYSPEHSRYFCVVKDVTLRNAENAMAMAYRDALTGLSNRLFMDDNFPRVIERATEESQPVAVLFLDLDGFKAVNDTLGHKAGDLLLQKVAERMREVVDDTDFALIRLGGDEFVAVGPANRDQASGTAQELVKIIGAPFLLGGHEVKIGVSIGISMLPDHGPTPDSLLEKADAAMYQVKKSGKNNWAFAADDRIKA